MLEAVEVDEQRRNRYAAPASRGHRALQELHEQRSFRECGQRVVGRLVRQLLFRVPAVGDVTRHELHRGLAVPHRGHRRHLDLDSATVDTDQPLFDGLAGHACGCRDDAGAGHVGRVGMEEVDERAPHHVGDVGGAE